MINEKDIRNKEKVKFYFQEKQKCHIKLIDRNFLNGFFQTDLNAFNFYWFVDDVDGRVKLWLSDIFDVDDFKEKEDEEVEDNE